MFHKYGRRAYLYTAGANLVCVLSVGALTLDRAHSHNVWLLWMWTCMQHVCVCMFMCDAECTPRPLVSCAWRILFNVSCCFARRLREINAPRVHKRTICIAENTHTHKRNKRTLTNSIWSIYKYSRCMYGGHVYNKSNATCAFQLTKSFQLPALPRRCQRTRKLLRVHEAFALRGAALLWVARCSARS